jgi:hypothetical protein
VEATSVVWGNSSCEDPKLEWFLYRGRGILDWHEPIRRVLKDRFAQIGREDHVISCSQIKMDNGTLL